MQTVIKSVKTPSYFQNDGKTQQHFKDVVNINKIIDRSRQRVRDSEGRVIGKYGDFRGMVDYQTAVIKVREANEAFMEIDPFIRKKFRNDPGLFLEFINNPENQDACIEMGIMTPPEGYKQPKDLEGDEKVQKFVSDVVEALKKGKTEEKEATKAPEAQ